jgi:hypothetical protein
MTEQSNTQHGVAIVASEERIAALRQLTPMELRQLGLAQLGYLRLGQLRNGETTYALLAADGSTVALADDVDAAMDLADEHELTLLTVH